MPNQIEPPNRPMNPSDRGRWFLQWIAPELLLVDSKSERRAVWTRAQSKALAWRVVWLNLLMIGPLVVLQYAGVKWFLPWMLRLGLPYVGALLIEIALFQILITGAIILVFRLCQKPLRQAIRAELLKRGHVLCLGCGYNCRGLREPRCPECGETFDAALLKPSTAAPDGDGHE